jgi:hypothetical protein
MKHALTMLLAVAALPLLAEEPAKKTAATQTSTAAAEAPAQQDSPLVAAAKRANRLGKKPANVITNQNLVKASSATRVTTTTNQGSINMPPPPQPTPEMIHAQKRAEERRQKEAEAKRNAERERREKEKRERAYTNAEEGTFDEMDSDSAASEKDAAQTQKKPPQV